MLTAARANDVTDKAAARSAPARPQCHAQRHTFAVMVCASGPTCSGATVQQRNDLHWWSLHRAVSVHAKRRDVQLVGLTIAHGECMETKINVERLSVVAGVAFTLAANSGCLDPDTNSVDLADITDNALVVDKGQFEIPTTFRINANCIHLQNTLTVTLNGVALTASNGSATCRKTYEPPYFTIPASLSAAEANALLSAPVLKLVVKDKTASMTLEVKGLSTSAPMITECTGISECCVASVSTGTCLSKLAGTFPLK
jgi:hypothetical protein